MAEQNDNPEALADRVQEDLRITEEERRGTIPGSIKQQQCVTSYEQRKPIL